MGRPMPPEVRQTLRAVQHPARAVDCPHCHAHPHRPCTSPSKRRVMPDPHPARIDAHATLTAVCPACQVEPGVPCHLNGRPINTAHPQRHQTAKETTA